MAKQTFNSFDALKSLLPEDESRTQQDQTKPKKVASVKVKFHKTKSSKAKPGSQNQKKSAKPKAPVVPEDPKLKAIFDALAWLNETFPNTFTKPGLPAKPLKVGIGQDLNAYLSELEDKEISLTLMRKSLSVYTKSFRYLLACTKVGNGRVDLKGEVTEKITEEQAKYAEQKLNDLKERRQKRHQAQKDEQNADHSTQ